MSREIVLFIAASLDGYIAKENDDLEWLMETEGEGDNGYTEMYETIDTIIMGKKNVRLCSRAYGNIPVLR